MDTKQKIVQAAVEIFAERGRHGARMEEIAARAEVNKAMVYYYFTTKENLFHEVIVLVMRELYQTIFEQLGKPGTENDNLLDRIRHMVTSHFEAFALHANYAKVFVQAITHDPDEVKNTMDMFRKANSNMNPQTFLSVFEEGKEKNIFRAIDTQQALICLMGMSMILFFGKPMAEVMFHSVPGAADVQGTSGETITDLFLYGIVKRT
jgi:AcrR family transcriptional regulator